MRMKHGAWLASMAVLILGCQTQGSGGSSGVGGDGGSSATTTSTGDATTGGVVPEGRANLAMLYSELTIQSDHPGLAEAISGDSTPIDPQSLLLFLSDRNHVCTNPFGFDEGCAGQYLITIALPPALQAVGTYPLNHLAAISYNGDDCSTHFTSYWDGTIEALSISATEVIFKLAGADGKGPASMQYIVERCF
jgi:hypothetical protein